MEILNLFAPILELLPCSSTGFALIPIHSNDLTPGKYGRRFHRYGYAAPLVDGRMAAQALGASDLLYGSGMSLPQAAAEKAEAERFWSIGPEAAGLG